MAATTLRIPINIEVFKWARKELNLSYNDIAQSFHKKEEEIIDWETGKVQPTYRQLEILSYRIFRIPLATFLLPEAPTDVSINRNFRSLPDYFLDATSYKTKLALKRGVFLKSALQEIFGSNPSDDPIFKKVQANRNVDQVSLSKIIREELNINLNKQKKFINNNYAFNYYRYSIEERGIFIFQLQLEGDRAFCLNDEEFPIIIVNSGDSISSRIFSLFHELTHIIINTNDIFRSISEPFHVTDATEIYCNEVASEVLVPKNELLMNPYLKQNGVYFWNESIVSRLANEYSVSREVILRKLMDEGLVSVDEYNKLKQKWDEEYKIKIAGYGNYYINKISSLGKNFIQAVIENYSKGKLSDSQVNDFLNIKLSNLLKLEERLY